jgi:hypothetical protein
VSVESPDDAARAGARQGGHGVVRRLPRARDGGVVEVAEGGEVVDHVPVEVVRVGGR